MSSILDRATTYRSAPRKAVLGSLRRFSEQCARGFRGGRAVRFPRAYRGIRNIVVFGMGGSALGTDVIRSVFADELRVPLTVVNGYHAPACVTSRTLVVLSSYSGTTEEVLSAAIESSRRGAKITGLTRGGTLKAFFIRRGLPWYQIDGAANPAGQPRMGLGYNVMGQVGLLASAGLVKLSGNDVRAITRHLDRRSASVDVEVPLRGNEAKRLASALAGRLPVVVGASHTVGSAHAFANQLNETAKSFAMFFALPELNHHLLEGLRSPREVRRGSFVFLTSNFYDRAIVKRMSITSQIVLRRGLAAEKLAVQGKNLFMQAMDALLVAGYASFYLSIVNRVDPLDIGTVDEFKKRLAR